MALQVQSARSTAMRKPKAPEANRARILAAAITEFAVARLQGREHGRDRRAHAAPRAR